MNAAEPVRASTIRGWHTLFGLDHVMMTGYGLAEATLSVTCTQRGAAIEIDDRGLACLGAPLPGVEVAIVDGERRLSPGDEGEIVVRSPSRFLGYADDPRATDAVLWQGTHVRTGDLGRLDDRGRLYFVARDKDVIKIAGRTIAPQEVEELVDADPRVRLCAALGIDRGGIEGEQLVVCAELRESRTAAPDDAHAVLVGIAHQLHQAIGVRPQRTLLLEPGAIPLTQNGKLQRSVLRAAVTDGTIKDRLIDPRMPPKRAP
jgi:acyl-CoA synthetase (AMP-forming)/AMP-acid ligase II